MICGVVSSVGAMVSGEGIVGLEQFFFAGPAGGLDSAAVPRGGGGNGPCRCAAIGSARTVHAITKSVMTPKVLHSFTKILEMTVRILSGLLILSYSLLYSKI